MPTQLEKLIAIQERAEQQKHEAERKAKLAKKQIAELQHKERNHRLIVRGAYLKKLLREPEILTDEDVFKILEHAFGTPYVREHLTDFLAKKRQEATMVLLIQQTDEEPLAHKGIRRDGHAGSPVSAGKGRPAGTGQEKEVNI